MAIYILLLTLVNLYLFYIYYLLYIYYIYFHFDFNKLLFVCIISDQRNSRNVEDRRTYKTFTLLFFFLLYNIFISSDIDLFFGLRNNNMLFHKSNQTITSFVYSSVIIVVIKYTDLICMLNFVFAKNIITVTVKEFWLITCII